MIKYVTAHAWIIKIDEGKKITMQLQVCDRKQGIDNYYSGLSVVQHAYNDMYSTYHDLNLYHAYEY